MTFAGKQTQEISYHRTWALFLPKAELLLGQQIKMNTQFLAANSAGHSQHPLSTNSKSEHQGCGFQPPQIQQHHRATAAPGSPVWAQGPPPPQPSHTMPLPEPPQASAASPLEQEQGLATLSGAELALTWWISDFSQLLLGVWSWWQHSGFCEEGRSSLPASCWCVNEPPLWCRD